MPYGISGNNAGVKYIKINRYDSGGIDRSDYLGQLTSVRIVNTDIGTQLYNIVTVQEQQDYYVYGVQTHAQNTSSVNYNILSSSIGMQNATPFTTILDDKTTVGVDVGGYTVLSGNASLLGSFGSYLVPRTPNVQLFLTISASYTNSSGLTSNARLFYGTYNDDISQTFTIDTNGSPTSISNGSSGILAFTWSNFSSNILENDLFNSYVFGIITNDSTLNITNFKVIVSQSQAPNFNYPTLTIFNPEFIDFDYNDYNALFW